MNKKILYGLVSIIVLAGIIMYFVQGFNVGTVYGANTKLGLYIENGINLDEIKTIANESFAGKDARYQNVEYFGEMVLITLPQVSDEEINTFITKINEKYSLEYKTEDIGLISMPAMSFGEIVQPYLVPVLVTIAISVIYFAIRYKLLGFGKMMAKTLIVILSVEAVILSIYLIANIVIDMSIVPVMLVGLGIAYIYTATDNNKLLEVRKREIAEQENNK